MQRDSCLRSDLGVIFVLLIYILKRDEPDCTRQHTGGVWRDGICAKHVVIFNPINSRPDYELIVP